MQNKKKNKRPKVGLAFSGGSALGIAHIGVIKALRENKIPIDYVSGTSAGAIAAACLAFDVPLKKMIETSKKINWDSISDFAYSKSGLNSNEPICDIIIEAIGNMKIEDAKIPLAIVATNIDNGQKIVFRKGSVAQAIMASTCIPGYFTPVKIDGKKMVDGGLVENLPLSPLEKMGAEIKIGVNLRRNAKCRKTKNVLDVINNAYKILSESQDFLTTKKAEIIVEPDLEKFDSNDFENYEILLERGYRATKKMMLEIKKCLNLDIVKKKSFLQKMLDFLRIKFGITEK